MLNQRKSNYRKRMQKALSILRQVAKDMGYQVGGHMKGRENTIDTFLDALIENPNLITINLPKVNDSGKQES